MTHELEGGSAIADPPSLHRRRSGSPRERTAARRSAATRRLAAVIVSSTVLAGLVSTGIVVHDRGGADVFRVEQSSALRLKSATELAARSVEAVVAEAPEPVEPAARTPPVEVRCRPGAADGPLRDPWSCSVRYRSGTEAHYRVQVRPNGYYSGTGTGSIDGCCVRTPMLN